MPSTDADDSTEEKPATVPTASNKTGDDGRPLLVTPGPPALPFEKLTPDGFERLVRDLIELDPLVGPCRQWGVSGQPQDGIDLYARLRYPSTADRKYLTVQCRNTATIGATRVARLVQKFLSGRWARQSDTFVLATRTSIRHTGTLQAIEAATDGLESAGVRFELWDGQELSRRLRRLPLVVEANFGVATARGYCPASAAPKGRRPRTLVVAAAVVALLVTLAGFATAHSIGRVGARSDDANEQSPLSHIAQIEPSESGGYVRLSTVMENPSAAAQTITGISLVLTVPRWNPWISPLGHDTYRMKPVGLIKEQRAGIFAFSAAAQQVGDPGEAHAGSGPLYAPASPTLGPAVELRGEVDRRPGQEPTLRLEFDPTTVLQPDAVTGLVLELPSKLALTRDPSASALAAADIEMGAGNASLPSMSQIARIEIMTRIAGAASGTASHCVARSPSPSVGIWGAC
jgi:hypothetical protein